MFGSISRRIKRWEDGMCGCAKSRKGKERINVYEIATKRETN